MTVKNKNYLFKISFYPPACASSLFVIKAAIELDSCSRHGGASGKLVGKSLYNISTMSLNKK